MSINTGNVYNDKKAYVKAVTGYRGKIERKPQNKFRLFVREIADLFIFFFMTSQEWPDRNYIKINKRDWIKLEKYYFRLEKTKVEITDPCYLSKSEMDNKLRRKILRLVGVLNQEVIQKINEERIKGRVVNPRKSRQYTLPIDLAFIEKSTAKQKIEELGLY